MQIALDGPGPEKSLAQPDKARIGMHPHPADIGELADPDRFDLGDLHSGDPRHDRLTPMAAVNSTHLSGHYQHGNLWPILRNRQSGIEIYGHWIGAQRHAAAQAFTAL